MTIRIAGTGSALPEYVRTNKEIEGFVETTDEWIRERTGICERRISQGDTVVSLAVSAAKKALEAAGMLPEDLDFILLATCSPEYLLPSASCQVQGAIGAKKAVCMDLNAACSGFLFSLETAYAYIHSGIYKNALIIGSEVLSKLVDWTDRGTCILFGDGAGAVVVETAEEGFLSMVQGSNGALGRVLSCDLTTDKFIHMDGKEVYRFATRQVPMCIEEAVAKAGLRLEEIDYFFLHQANARILESVSKRLAIPMEKIPMNLDRVGNTSSASIPILLDEIAKCGKIQKGQKIVLSGFGAGLTYSACVIIWG